MTDFITTQDVVDYLGRGDTTDAGLTIAVASACDIVRSLTGQDFDLVPHDVVVLDGTGTDCLLLPQLPVSSIDSVFLEDVDDAITDYALRDDGCLIRILDDTSTVGFAKWPEGRQNVTVTYNHGFANDAVPNDVMMVALMVASRLAVQGPLKSESIGQVSATYAVAATDLTEGEKLILRKYRR